MALDHTHFTSANTNSAAHRLDRRPTSASAEAQAAHYERCLSELAASGMGWTKGYKELATKLAQLRGA